MLPEREPLRRPSHCQGDLLRGSGVSAPTYPPYRRSESCLAMHEDIGMRQARWGWVNAGPLGVP
jgi:hypothetical protein